MDRPLVEAIMSQARASLEQQATQAGVNLTPWFEGNAPRLKALGAMLGIVFTQLAQQERAKSSQQLAVEGLGAVERLVATKHPTESAWFARNHKLLLWMAQSLAAGMPSGLAKSGAHSAGPQPPQAPQAVKLAVEVTSKPSRTEADRKSLAVELEEQATEPALSLEERADRSMAGQWQALQLERLKNVAEKAFRSGERAVSWLVSRVAQHRPDLSAELRHHLRTLSSEESASDSEEQSTEGIAELRSSAERIRASLAAINLLRRGTPIAPEERPILAQYSGLGGLSRKALSQVLPPEWLPEERGLIHEYYTPPRVAAAIAEALRPRLPALADASETILALEPSAGIGRLIQALTGDGFDRLRWHACEYSRISGQLLAALRPEIDVFIGPFEQWVQDRSELQGQISLVVSNPPYGERGKALYLDPDKTYREKKAYVYQMRRALDFLRPGGIGVFLVPAGFLTGRAPSFVETRSQVLRRHHLMGAFRLPSETEDGQSLFPGALLVTDVLFFRSRGGELAAVLEEDRFILEGDYFKQTPAHILGREVGGESDEDDQTAKPRWGYQVRGTFERLPDFEERPICRDCTVQPLVFSKPKPLPILPEPVREALQLARRTSQYLAEVSRGDPASLQRAQALHADLKEALLAWHAQPGEAKQSVAAMLTQVPALQPLFTAKAEGGLLSVLETPPAYVPKYIGLPDDVASQAAFLYGLARILTLAQLVTFHREVGGQLSDAEIRARLIAGGMCFDGDEMDAIVPAQHYYTGALWERYDRAKAAADRGDPQAAHQATKLLEVIKPATFAEIQTEPRLGWLPLSALQAFVTHYLSKYEYDRSNYRLERQGALLSLAGVPYADLAHAPRPLQELLGYLNHDMTFFRPRVEREKEDLEEKRLERAQKYKDEWTQWIESEPEVQAEIVQTFNRLFRGWEAPTYSGTDLEIARWNSQFPLYPYQNAGVRRLVANHGGGLFFDVGLGKTRTILAALALARQEGWARRAMVGMPNSMAWNWLAEIERVLPDFRVVLIGVKKKVVQRGARKGQIESETDTPRERADKWQRFKAGLYDVAFVTYSTLARTRMRMETLLSLIRESLAIQRELGLQLRSLEMRIAALSKKRQRGKLTESQQAELQQLIKQYGKMPKSERRAAINAEKEEALAAKYQQLPAGQEFDPDIYFEDLGIDWLAYDESHMGKNLWTVGAREGGEPRFLGAPQAGSDIAWQMYFRACIVRKHAGGAGVHLADATPAKNSPLEFLSLLSLIDDKVWSQLGISDPEQYLTQYLRIERKLIQDTDLTLAERPCVVGFQNLDQLREVLFRYGEFRTAKEVGLKIPEPSIHRIEVEMNAAQEAKYEDYLEQYQTALSSTSFNPESRVKALGLLLRMGLAAVHQELDEGPGGQTDEIIEEGTDEEGDGSKKKTVVRRGGWTFGNAHQASTYASPKLDKIAELISSRKDCGHLVFLENNATHFWLKERLVDMGVERNRIAVLNGETAANTMVRQRIAEGFTADESLYDVVIANKIAYEGLNLQTRTCAIYHGDLPWEPATLQQRNGRGQRQGNRYEVIHIYYILSKRSMDMARFQLIAGKREWMAALLESAASETNNPAAQAEMSPEDWLIYLSRDGEKTKQLLEQKKAKQREEEHQKIKKLAWASIRAISVRQRDMPNADLFQRTRLTEEITNLSEELNEVDPEVWPWKFLVPLVAQHPSLSFAPAHEGVIWEGAHYRRFHPDGEELDAAEFGRIVYTPRVAIGYRPRGQIMWEELSPEVAQKKWTHTRPADWQHERVPYSTELERVVREFLLQLRHEGVWIYRDAHFELASQGFLEFLWKEHGEAIVEALAASQSAYQTQIPVATETGIVITHGKWRNVGRLLPFTAAGYQEFLTLGRTSSLKWTELESASEWWWGRHIPRNLLVGNREASNQPSTEAA